jgi:hypothetical protein
VNENQVLIAAEITVDSPDFGHLEPMVDAALSELEKVGTGTASPELGSMSTVYPTATRRCGSERRACLDDRVSSGVTSIDEAKRRCSLSRGDCLDLRSAESSVRSQQAELLTALAGTRTMTWQLAPLITRGRVEQAGRLRLERVRLGWRSLVYGDVWC